MIAKELIRDYVRDWKAGKVLHPIVEHLCANLWCYESPDPMAIPDSITGAELEQRVDGRWLVDVALMKGDTVAAAVEVVHTHKMDERKIDEISIGWIEVAAAAIIRDPSVWRATRSKRDHFCQRCAEAKARSDKLAAECAKNQRSAWEITAQIWGGDVVARLQPNYDAYLCPCFWCSKPTAVFRYVGEYGGEVFGDATKPPEPRPRSIRWAPVTWRGWCMYANHCMHCGKTLPPREVREWFNNCFGYLA